MADGFEERLYALVDDSEAPGKIEAFKAKGEGARIFADLSKYADIDGFVDDLMDLMQAFGVSPPEVRSFKTVLSERFETKTLRDFTVGELKQIVADGRWPDDATF